MCPKFNFWAHYSDDGPVLNLEKVFFGLTLGQLNYIAILPPFFQHYQRLTIKCTSRPTKSYKSGESGNSKKVATMPSSSFAGSTIQYLFY